eukprot:6202603-Pleurochrysis_carterae.AAC.2
MAAELQLLHAQARASVPRVSAAPTAAVPLSCAASPARRRWRAERRCGRRAASGRSACRSSRARPCAAPAASGQNESRSSPPALSSGSEAAKREKKGHCRASSVVLWAHDARRRGVAHRRGEAPCDDQHEVELECFAPENFEPVRVPVEHLHLRARARGGAQL